MKYDLITLEAVDRGGRTNMVLWGRDENGNRKRFVDKTWSPHFFIPKGALFTTPILHRTNEMWPDLFGEWTEKVTTPLSGNVTQLRKLFNKHWQADVMPEIAYLVERNIFASFEALVVDRKLKLIPCNPIYAPLRICFMDMEVDATPERFPEAKDALEAIVSVATFDMKLKLWVLFCWRQDQVPCEVLVSNDTIARIYNNETDLVKAIVKYYSSRGFDGFIGWNTNTWDWVYLINRCRILRIDCSAISPLRTFYYRERFDPETKQMKIQIVCKGRVMLDGLDTYKKMTSFEAKLESYSLEYVVWYELKEVRIKQVIHDLWQSDDILDVAFYPKKDTDWVIRIFEKRKILNYFTMIRHYTGCRLEEAHKNSKVLDSLILHFAHNEGIVLPSKAPYDPAHKPKGSSYKGAMVREPKVGLHWNVGVLDFKSHYPYIIIACNMSPEKLDPNGDIEVGNGIRFSSKGMGFVPRVISGLVNKRGEITTQMEVLIIDSPEWKLLYQHQFALKFLITSFYGVFAYSGFRLYKIEIAYSITFLGRDLMQHAITTVESGRWIVRIVLYGDTDSFFVTMHRVSWEELTRVCNRVNAELRRLCIERKYQTYVSMKPERVYDGIIFTYLRGAAKIKLRRRKKKKVQEGAKKKYYGRIKWQDSKFLSADKWDNKNMAAKRSDSSRFTHEVQTKVLQDPINKVPVTVVEAYLAQMKLEIKNRPLVEIGIPRGVKTFHDNSPWGHGALWMRDHFDPLVLQHLKPKLLYVKPAEIAKLKKRNGEFCAPTDAVCFDDPATLPPEIHKCIDWDKMIQKTITAKTEEIIAVISTQKQRKMEAFM